MHSFNIILPVTINERKPLARHNQIKTKVRVMSSFQETKPGRINVKEGLARWLVGNISNIIYYL